MYMSGIVNIQYKSAGQSMENLPHNVRSPDVNYTKWAAC